MVATLLRYAPPLALLVAPAFASQDPAPATDKELASAWKKLSKEERSEVIQWFTAEIKWLDSYQGKLIRHVLSTHTSDPYDWPEAENAPLYDPKVHAPAQVIRRRWVSERSSRSKKLMERIFAKVPERRLESAWRYDYGSREVVRTAPLGDDDRIFRNAVAGFPPDLDLAEAMVERILDDGAEQKMLAALGHAYADRDGYAFRGVTLYDAWCSGMEMEMPDVECLGIVHDVLGDYRTWVAPIPASKHDALYERIGELFVDARRHRGLRHALARTYLTGDAVLRDGYQPNLVRLHGIWELHSSTPARLAEELPPSKKWVDWLERVGKKVDTTKEHWEAGLNRRATLAADSANVRATLVRVMREFGALKDG